VCLAGDARGLRRPFSPEALLRAARTCQRQLESGFGGVLSERASESGRDDRLTGVNVVHGNASDEATVAVEIRADDGDAAAEHQDSRKRASAIAERLLSLWRIDAVQPDAHAAGR